MPWSVVLTGFSFNVLNAYLNARWISHLGSYADAAAREPWFVAGAVLFFAGLGVNRIADRELFRLRAASGERRYAIPRGKLFALVSCPNYLGEIVQWSGWALLTLSWPGLAFAFYTLANLGPRAISHHAWYRSQFPDYPPARKALIPFVV
jgi:steroid 5-alpha reductase family enzyme